MHNMGHTVFRVSDHFFLNINKSKFKSILPEQIDNESSEAFGDQKAHILKSNHCMWQLLDFFKIMTSEKGPPLFFVYLKKW